MFQVKMIEIDFDEKVDEVKTGKLCNWVPIFSCKIKRKRRLECNMHTSLLACLFVCYPPNKPCHTHKQAHTHSYEIHQIDDKLK